MPKIRSFGALSHFFLFTLPHKPVDDDGHWTKGEADSVVMAHSSSTINENILGKNFLVKCIFLALCIILITGNYQILVVVMVTMVSGVLFTPLLSYHDTSCLVNGNRVCPVKPRGHQHIQRHWYQQVSSTRCKQWTCTIWTISVLSSHWHSLSKRVNLSSTLVQT